jgi:hypothetical protein
MEKTQDKYREIHENLAVKFDTDHHIICFIRGMVGEYHFSPHDLSDWLMKKLKTARSENKIKRYRERLHFVGQLSMSEFNYIITFEG